jgi:mono/diheme cytochrome c family protein
MTSRRLHWPVLAIAMVAFGAFALTPHQPAPAQAQAPAAPLPPVGDIAQGKYLVEGIGFCLFCHGQNLQGLAQAPNSTIPSPKLAGLPMFQTDDQAITFFKTGTMPNGTTARRPMPGFRFSHSDAVALVAYLRSLK